MRITKFPSKEFAKILATGLTVAATITTFYSASLPKAQAQVPDGRYEVRGTQILFHPAGGQNPVLVYNAGGTATHIINYNGAIYTAFRGGSIYRSPDGQNLGGGGRTTKAYAGSATVSAMLVCQNALFTAFKGGYIYRSPDGQNLGGGGNTESVYRGSGQVSRMTCSNRNSVITAFTSGQVYESPDGRNLGGGGRTFRLTN